MFSLPSHTVSDFLIDKTLHGNDSYNPMVSIYNYWDTILCIYDRRIGGPNQPGNRLDPSKKALIISTDISGIFVIWSYVHDCYSSAHLH